MKNWKIHITFVSLLTLILGNFHNANAQQNFAQQAYAIFEQSCLNCHGEHGAFTEEIIIDHTALIETGAVVPGKPAIESELYKRLLTNDPAKRMPLGQPQLPPAAILTIGNWIQAGAPNWEDTVEADGSFITSKEMLESIEKHINSLAPFDRSFARYFTMTHLYNAGESAEALHAYQRALSKLVNSLSWGRTIKVPQPIDPKETIFYIDLRDYEWEIGTNRWTLIETEYPYKIEFEAPTHTSLREKLANLREEMNCEVPFVHVDWFLATASLPPLYHDILDLPETDQELETRLEVNVVENLRNAAGRRVWRAGFNDSGVSNHNRVVERHESRYGAYWKSYDFAGSKGTQNVLTHPLSFTHDGGEIIFNLPNGLQAYLLVDAGGRRLNEAPIKIVRNLAASDPTVRNGLSCIGCHTEGMKDFEDQVRGVVQKNPNPPYNKDRALQLYTDEATMDAFVAEDTIRYREALEVAGGVFGGIEPVQRFHEAFQRPVDAVHAAAAVGLETEAFLQNIRVSARLKSLGLLVLENGTMKRDTWTEQFSEVIFALDFPDVVISVDPQTERIPGASVYIPDVKLRAVIEEALGKAQGAPITVKEIEGLERLVARDKGIQDLIGLQSAINLSRLSLSGNQISDLSPIVGLTGLHALWLSDNPVSDLSPLKHLTNLALLVIDNTHVSNLSPLAGLINLEELGVSTPLISDLSPLKGLKNLRVLWFHRTQVSDLSPLAGLINLEELYANQGGIYEAIRRIEEQTGIVITTDHGNISDLSPLAGLINLRRIWFWGNPISDLSPLAGLTKLEKIDICGGNISNLKPLVALKNLKELFLAANEISDISLLAGLTEVINLDLRSNDISDISPLAGLARLNHLRLNDNNISDFSPLDRIRQNITLIWHDNPGFPKGGPKIEGPWLWVILPDADLESGSDLLSEASGGTVKEIEIATHGATAGQSVGSSIWTSHKLPYTGRIEDMLKGAVPDGVIYGVVSLYSPREQETTIGVGSRQELKVWFNGTLIHQHGHYDRVGNDYTDFYPVTLQPGRNVLLVAFRSNANGVFGFETGTEYIVSNSGIGYNFSETAIHIGDTFIVELNAENVSDLAGWQFDVVFDPAVLEAVEVNEGDFLKTGGEATFFQRGTIDNRSGKIKGLSSARLGEDGVSGTGTLLSVTFTAKAAGQTQLRLDNFQLAAITGKPIDAGPHEVAITVGGEQATGDVNRDGQVSILDMVLVARHLGKTVPANSDVDLNGDGIINILDLILVSQNMGESNGFAAPSMLSVDDIHGLDPAVIQWWIEHAQLEDDGSIAFQEGIANLQRLLASLIPEDTVLLPNYPNPFNPETWIPYQLSEPAEVTLRIYAINGKLVRILALGQMPAGVYQSRSRAAYWNGRNTVGERVSNGVYFYTLTAEGFSATRKMLILK